VVYILLVYFYYASGLVGVFGVDNEIKLANARFLPQELDCRTDDKIYIYLLIAVLIWLC